MNARQAIVVAVAGALGVWVAIAAAQGGLGGGGTGTGCSYISTSGVTTGVGCPRGTGGGPGGTGGPHHRHHGHPGGSANPGEREGGSAGTGRRRHHRRLTFTFVVRLGHGASGISVSGYTAHVRPPRHSPASCQARVARMDIKGKKHQLARVRVRPPQHGWCHGRYRVTVSLKR